MNKYWNVENLFFIGTVAAVVVCIFALIYKERMKKFN